MSAILILGLGSRYSYLAATHLRGIERDFGVSFHWWPLHSPDLIARAQGDRSPVAARQRFGRYHPSYRDTDARRWVEICWSFAEPGTRRRPAKAFPTAIFAEGQRPEAKTIAAIAEPAGPPDKDGAAAHASAVAAALPLGDFGLPTVVLDGKTYWGNDRLPLVRAALAGRRKP